MRGLRSVILDGQGIRAVATPIAALLAMTLLSNRQFGQAVTELLNYLTLSDGEEGPNTRSDE